MIVKLNPLVRVVASDCLIALGLATVWLGYGPWFLFPALGGWHYLTRQLAPRIPGFTDRGHPVWLSLVWQGLIVVIFLVFVAAEYELIPHSITVVFARVVIPLFLIGNLWDNIRTVQSLNRCPRLASGADESD